MSSGDFMPQSRRTWRQQNHPSLPIFLSISYPRPFSLIPYDTAMTLPTHTTASPPAPLRHDLSDGAGGVASVRGAQQAVAQALEPDREHLGDVPNVGVRVLCVLCVCVGKGVCGRQFNASVVFPHQSVEDLFASRHVPT